MDTRTGHLSDAGPLDRFHEQLTETAGELEDLAGQVDRLPEKHLEGGEGEEVAKLREDLEAKLDTARDALAGVDAAKLTAALEKLTRRPRAMLTRRQKARIRILRRALAGRGDYIPVPDKLEAEARRELAGRPDTFVKPGGKLDKFARQDRQRRRAMARRQGQR